jgi:HEAT repeat protein
MRWVALGMVVAFSAGCSDKSYSDDLLHASSEKRVAAAAFLGAQRDQNAVGALIAVLGDSSVSVRTKAAWALGMIRAREAVTPLLVLLKDPDRGVKQAAIGALMNIEEPGALPSLREALSSEPDVWVIGDLEKAIGYLSQFEGETDVGESTFN